MKEWREWRRRWLACLGGRTCRGLKEASERKRRRGRKHLYRALVDRAVLRKT